MPAKEVSWGFAWKALHHSDQNGVIALLLKATSFITSQSSTIVKARKKWMETILLKRVINFADTRFQLFDGGDAPTALMIYKSKNNENQNYIFDYWVPKADLNLKSRRLMTLSRVDQAKLPIAHVLEDQLLMKRRMWMQTPDAKLFQYLSGFPKISEKVVTHQSLGKKSPPKNKWVIGQGFNPAQEHRLGEASYKTVVSEIVSTIPHLEMKEYSPLAMPSIVNEGWHTKTVYRKNFEGGYSGPHILIPQGIKRSTGRLRASYCAQDLSFRTSIQSISFKKSSENEAKFLTLFLNSSLAAWLLFHNSSVAGMERDKVPQQEVLELPFPSVTSMNNSEKAQSAFEDAVSLIDAIIENKDNLLQSRMSEYLSDIDNIIYRYFDLNKADIILIEDTLHHIIPSMQPHVRSKKAPSLWADTKEEDWEYYSKCLTFSLDSWLEKPFRATSNLVGVSADLVVIGVHLTDDPDKPSFLKNKKQSSSDILSQIWRSLPKEMPGNFQMIPDLRIFIDDVLYIVKPRKKRFWLGAAALADADAIASDLLSQKG